MELKLYRTKIDGIEHIVQLEADAAKRAGAVPLESGEEPVEAKRLPYFPTAREQEELAVRKASDDAARSLAAKPQEPATVGTEGTADVLATNDPAAESVAPTQEMNAAEAAEEEAAVAEDTQTTVPDQVPAKQAPAAPKADREALDAAKARRAANKSRAPQSDK